MKFLRRLVIAIGLFFLILFLVIAGAVWWLNRFIQGPEFANEIKSTATEVTGVPVNFSKVKWDIGHSFNVEKWQMQNQSPDGKTAFFNADEIQLAYNWESIWNRTFDITDFYVSNPSLLIAQQNNGEFLLPFVMPKNNGSTPSAKTQNSNSSLQIILHEFKLEKGSLEVKNADNSSRLLCAGITLTGNAPRPEETSFQGNLTINQITVSNRVNLTSFHSPYSYRNGSLDLSSLEASAYSGKINGNIEINLLDPKMPYSLKIDFQDVDVNQLLTQVAQRPNVISGKMEGKTSWIGSATDPMSISGKGTIVIRNGQMINVPFFRDLSQMLGGQNAIAQPDFSECSLDYSVADQVVNVQSIDLKSSLFELSGSGKIKFDSTLDLNMNLALNPELTKQIPNTITDFLTSRSDGYKLVPFKVTGPFNQPKIDLALNKEQLLNQATQTLQNIFGAKKGNESGNQGSSFTLPAGLQNLLGHKNAPPSPTPIPSSAPLATPTPVPEVPSPVPTPNP